MEIEEAYAVLGLCNVLVKQFNVFPRATKSFDEALVSFRRVERFLLLPEATPPPTPPESQHASLEASQTLVVKLYRASVCRPCHGLGYWPHAMLMQCMNAPRSPTPRARHRRCNIRRVSRRHVGHGVYMVSAAGSVCPWSVLESVHEHASVDKKPLMSAQ